MATYYDDSNSFKYGPGSPAPASTFTGARIMPSQPSAVVVGGSSNSGSSGSTNYQNGGWYMHNGKSQQYWNGSWYDTPQQGISNNQPSQPSGPSQDEINAINDMFNPTMNMLNDREKLLREEEYPAEQKDLEDSFNNAIKTITTQRSNANEDYDSQNSQLSTTREKALTDLRRDLMALQQKVRVLFGSRSSVGQGATEIAQREFFRSEGNIDNTFQNNLGQLMLAHTRQMKAFDDTENETNQKYISEKNKLNIAFKDSINQINSQRGQAESAKAQMKLALLQQTNSEARALENWKQQQDYALNIVKQQLLAQQQTLGTAISQAQYNVPVNAFNNTNTLSPYSSSTFQSDYTPSNTTPINTRYLATARRSEDDLTNPFFS